MGHVASYSEANQYFTQISRKLKTIIFANSIRVQELLCEIMNKYPSTIHRADGLQKEVMAYDSLVESFLSEDNTLSPTLYSSVCKDIETLINN